MPRTILVVDDEPIALRMASAVLFKAGHQVITCTEPRDAFLLAARHHPDAILLDIVMPGTDGGALAQRLADADLTRDIPIIYLSSLLEAGNRPPASNRRGPWYLPKPLDPSALVALLDRIWSEA